MSAAEAIGTEFDLRKVVLAALEGDEPNPHVIASQLADALPIEYLRDIVRRTLPQYVSGVIHSQRAGRNLQQPQTAKAKASARWMAAAEHQESGALEMYRIRVCPGGEWKLLQDCSIRDIRTLASERRELADKNRAWADRFNALADHMHSKALPTVDRVDADDLRGFLDAS